MSKIGLFLVPFCLGVMALALTGTMFLGAGHGLLSLALVAIGSLAWAWQERD